MPHGAVGRVAANLAAIKVLRALEAGQRAATPDEQATLARWSGWGAVPAIFDGRTTKWAGEREQLRELLSEDAYVAARRTTINAHYTDAVYARAMWDALGRLGFDGGHVLEPGVGAGAFIATAPANAEMVGVELDPTTAAIAAARFPGATIRTESFAHTRVHSGFDAVVGNVPFGEISLHDPRHNRGRHSLHNHFIIKALSLTRPGGLMAVLTSRFTLDAIDPAAREEIAALATLIGAVRLPSGAHRQTAGTDVVTDLLLLRRHDAQASPPAADWTEVKTITVGDTDVQINAHFEEHPARVLGTYSLGRGPHGAQTLRVDAHDDDIAAAVDAALREITSPTRTSDVAPLGQELWDGHLTVRPDGTFTCVEDGVHVTCEVPASQRAELRELLSLRDQALALLQTESQTTSDTPDLDRRRRRALSTYEHYVARHGPINRFTERRTGRVENGTGEPVMARIAPAAIRTLRQDPYAPLVKALENFDESTQTATPAALLLQRTLVERKPIAHAERPEDALAICLEAIGRVDLDRIASLLGLTAERARAALGELVYDDPELRRLVPAAEYRSGDVRRKLKVATAAAESTPALAVNVDALTAVQPRDLGVEEVRARLGAVWIDPETHQQFLRELLREPTATVRSPGPGMWEVTGSWQSLAARSEWGTERVPAPQLMRAVLEQRSVQVFDLIDRTTRVLNLVETAAAAEKADALQERFGEWVWEGPERARRLLAEYNRRFNSLVLRDYTADGERLTLPGLATSFTPRPHQRTAVARMLGEPAVGLFHDVGAGKTAEIVIGLMEMRRLGLVTKPAVAVPNHMLEQFTREFLQLYPRARVLAASSADLSGEKRRGFVARMATNDWDAVLMTRSAFERLPVSDKVQRDYVREELAELHAALMLADGGDRRSIKRVEKTLLSAQAALERRLDGEIDPGITFEETGVDYLAIDEAHDYKNLRTVSNIRDAAIDGSRRATDLHMKLGYLRQRYGARVATLATATPIANSVAEGHVFLRYLRPDLLADAGVLVFDAWAATFGQVVTAIEMAPSGGRNYRLQARFARFQNVPEFVVMFHVAADVKTKDDLRLPTPLLRRRADGERKPETIVIKPSREVTDYVAALGARAQRIRNGGVDPREDNMLKVSTDGRKAALDMRLIDPSAVGGAKLDRVAAEVASVYHEHHDARYRDPATGEWSPVLGAMQLVFCDLGTPSEEWNAYGELRYELIARGVPREKVRFIHEARTDAEKARLFAAARAGNIAVLIGSTQKMGVGTNVQARVIWTHHVDCPYRSIDIRQRNGRADRQGNQNSEIGESRYVVEGSFDAYLWQMVARKARFIDQVMTGRLDAREIDDVGDNTLSYDEVKALASGDPLILEKAKADAELTRLQRLERAYRSNRLLLADTVAYSEARAERYARDVADLRRALTVRADTRGDAFRITIGDRVLTRRALAAEHLHAAFHTSVPRGGASGAVVLATLGGFDVTATNVQTVDGWAFEWSLAGVPALPISSDGVDLKVCESVLRRLEDRIARIPAEAAWCEQQRVDFAAQAEEAREGLRKPFKHTDALASTIARAEQIERAMQATEPLEVECDRTESSSHEARAPGDAISVQSAA